MDIGLTLQDALQGTHSLNIYSIHRLVWIPFTKLLLQIKKHRLNTNIFMQDQSLYIRNIYTEATAIVPVVYSNTVEIILQVSHHGL